MSIDHPNLSFGFSKMIAEMVDSPSVNIESLELNQEYITKSDIGLEYILKVVEIPKDRYKAARIEMTGPYNKDMFGKETVEAYFRGSCYSHGGLIRTDVITQGAMLEIAVPYQSLLVVETPGSHIYQFQIQSLGGIYSGLRILMDKEREETIQRIVDLPNAGNVAPGKVVKSVHEESITMEDVYTEYINMQERYALGRMGTGGERKVYKHGLPVSDLPTVNHCMEYYYKLWEKRCNEGDFEEAHFALVRVNTLDWWAGELDHKYK